MRYWLLSASAVFGTFVVVGCGTAAAPGSAYSGATTSVMSSASAPAPGMSSTASPSSAVLTVRKTPIGYVLANANGYTLYWFAKDPRGGSHPACAGSCVLAWFPVKGHPVPAHGTTLDGKLDCITRPGGVVQATYNGHPLYTFGSDSAPGMTNGDGSAGAWHVIKAKAPAATSASGY